MNMTSTVNHISEILPNQLYLGSQYGAYQLETLTSLGIRYILNVKGGAYATFEGFKKKIVVISDYGISDLESLLEECFKFIDEAISQNVGVIVHCQGGINRSPTVCIGYLLLRRGMTLKAAWDLVKKARPMSSPHELYWEQLRLLELKHHGSISLTKGDVGPTLQDQLREMAAKASQEAAENDEAQSAST